MRGVLLLGTSLLVSGFCLGSAGAETIAGQAISVPDISSVQPGTKLAAATPDTPATDQDAQAPPQQGQQPQPAPQAAMPGVEQVTITGARTQLVGTATTSSQGVVVQEELNLTPAFRPGQLLETIPGLVVTSHSGEGKANQYLLRGFNLDHGTDLATFVDDIPINQPTHAHGQGYTDLNFLIPETVSGVQFTKGPYYAEEGDFAAVGSDHISIVNTLPDQASVTVGTMGFERLFTGGAHEAGSGTVLGALEIQHYDGPWTHPDDQRKINALARYVQGDEANGFTLTAMYYGGLWNATTDQPVRAMDPVYMAGLSLKPIGRFNTLDPSDGGRAQQIHLSAEYHRDIGEGHFDANIFGVNNQMTLWNDFTHYLDDPVNGDQEAQTDNRRTVGGGASYDFPTKLFGLDTEYLGGVWARYDYNNVSRTFTKERQYLSTLEADRVSLGEFAAYIQATTHWTDWMRTVIGLREDYQTATDSGTNHGDASAPLFQPKGSLIIQPWDTTEFYVSAGRGYHSDDVRGVTQAKLTGVGGAPLIAQADGEEVGVRSTILPNLTATLTGFNVNFQSETTYDPDAGVDGAGPPSHRYGVEFNTTYAPFPWLEFYTSFAASHARYTQETDDGTGHVGKYIPNAPTIIANVAAYIKNLGPWAGGVEMRYLGAYALTPDNEVGGRGYLEVNVNGSYAFEDGWKLGMGIYNLFDTHADAAEFWYADRLPGEPADGVADRHIHPMEPRAFRFTLTKVFE